MLSSSSLSCQLATSHVREATSRAPVDGAGTLLPPDQAAEIAVRLIAIADAGPVFLLLATAAQEIGRQRLGCERHCSHDTVLLSLCVYNICRGMGHEPGHWASCLRH